LRQPAQLSPSDFNSHTRDFSTTPFDRRKRPPGCSFLSEWGACEGGIINSTQGNHEESRGPSWFPVFIGHALAQNFDTNCHRNIMMLSLSLSFSFSLARSLALALSLSVSLSLSLSLSLFLSLFLSLSLSLARSLALSLSLSRETRIP